MMVVTHEMGFARDVADVVAVMDGGVILESGSPDVIFTQPREAPAFLQAVLNNGQESRHEHAPTGRQCLGGARRQRRARRHAPPGAHRARLRRPGQGGRGRIAGLRLRRRRGP